jgi:hypothetical protein
VIPIEGKLGATVAYWIASMPPTPLQVCGDATAWGDGVVPVPSAHLEGAEQITLEGVYHSPLGASDGPKLLSNMLQSSADGSMEASSRWATACCACCAAVSQAQCCLAACAAPNT